jgi:hypothetical protein
MWLIFLYTKRRPTQRAPDPWENAKDRLLGLPFRGVRVFRQFAWLEVDSVKMALPRPAHTQVPRKARGAGRKPLAGFAENIILHYSSLNIEGTQS